MTEITHMNSFNSGSKFISPPKIQIIKNAQKELYRKELTHFVDPIIPNFNGNEMIVGFINIQSLPKSIKV